MYYVARLEGVRVRLRPDQLGDPLSAIREELVGALRGVEPFVVLTVERAVSFSVGEVDVEDGTVACEVGCDALVAAPFDGEVLDCRVFLVRPMLVVASAGAFDVSISAASHLPAGYDRFDSQRQAFVHDGGRPPIAEGCAVRLRVVSHRVAASKLLVEGSMRCHQGPGLIAVDDGTSSDFMGVLECAHPHAHPHNR